MIDIPIFNAHDFDYDYFRKFEILKKSSRAKNKNDILDCVCAFDIETTGLDDLKESIMYIWQFSVNAECCVIGRTWDEFIYFIHRVNGVLTELKSELIIYIHNADYEFSFLSSLIPFDDMFFTAPHKPLYFKYKSLQFRCSYILTNSSLTKFCKTWNVKHQKLDGDTFNYSIKRYPWTTLSDLELEYCVNDVIGLCEAVRAQMVARGDNLQTIPLTKTGYIRRKIKESFKDEDKAYKNGIKGTFNYFQRSSLQPDYDLLMALHEAFRGGNTHGSPLYASRTIKNVISKDESSAYPNAMYNFQFPIKPFKKVAMPLDNELDNLLKLNTPYVARVAFNNLRLKDHLNPCPYIAYHKCAECYDPILDNGRVRACEYAEMTIIDIDYRIIKNNYSWDDCIIIDLWTSKYGMLPDAIRRVIKELYTLKTALKNVDGAEIDYILAKEDLNSAYGCLCMYPLKPELIFDMNDGEYEYSVMSEEDIYNKIISNKKKAFLPYQWGVWVAAIGRHCLQLAIDIVDDPRSNYAFCYCDTDSIKYIPNEYSNNALDKLNKMIIDRSKKNGAYAVDPDGVTHYMGEFEADGEYDRFSTIGAKKYIYEDNAGIHITIAGVNKKIGALELVKVANKRNIDPFQLFNNQDIVFKEAGGTMSTYNFHKPKVININGNDIVVTSNIYISESTYSLGITDDYKQLINNDSFLLFLQKQLIENGFKF